MNIEQRISILEKKVGIKENDWEDNTDFEDENGKGLYSDNKILTLKVSFPNVDIEVFKRAKKYKVTLVDSGKSQDNLKITGVKQNVKLFLMHSGWHTTDIYKWYGI